MNNKKYFLAITVLVLATLACSINFENPITTELLTGPLVTEELNIPFLANPEAVAEVIINFGAGDLTISPDSEGALISGEVSYNVDDLKPDISMENEVVKIKTGSLDIDGIPRFNEKVQNTWDLNLSDKPMDLTIKAGAYVGELELGGLSLSSLHIGDGAAEVNLSFSEPNLIVMDTLRYETGASNIKLSNLSNANFNTMLFESGAGSYDLDFSGQLTRDADVFIETGLSTMTITVPENINVELKVEGALKNISTRGVWEQVMESYVISAEGPTLTIIVEMSAGNLILRN